MRRSAGNRSLVLSAVLVILSLMSSTWDQVCEGQGQKAQNEEKQEPGKLDRIRALMGQGAFAEAERLARELLQKNGLTQLDESEKNIEVD